MTRILFLHGFAQNPQEIRCKTRQIQQALGNCHFVFPAAAVQLVSYDGDIEDRARADQLCSKRYAWNTSSADMSSHLINMTIILQHLGPILEKQGPFDGIMGFSQGAAVACATTSILEKGLSNVRHPPFQFCVSFCGARPAAEEFDSIFSNIRTPSLHIIAKQDVMVPLDRSLTLVQAFSNSSVVYHPGTHTMPQRNTCIQQITDFVHRQIQSPKASLTPCHEAQNFSETQRPMNATGQVDTKRRAISRKVYSSRRRISVVRVLC